MALLSCRETIMGAIDVRVGVDFQRYDVTEWQTLNGSLPCGFGQKPNVESIPPAIRFADVAKLP